MLTELRNITHATTERLKYDARLQGLVAASLFFLGGIAIYIPDHQGAVEMGIAFPQPFYNRVFDMFGGGWAASMARIFRKDDIAASIFVGITAPGVIEKLQELGLVAGGYDAGDYIAPLFGLAAFLGAYYGIKLKNKVQQTRVEFLLGEDFPFKNIQDVRLIDWKFPLLRNPLKIQTKA
jgi:hypothetical protein